MAEAGPESTAIVDVEGGRVWYRENDTRHDRQRQRRRLAMHTVHRGDARLSLRSMLLRA